MADLELNNPAFDITVQLHGKDQKINVQPDETSDGVEYFICSTDDSKLTQIRLDEDQKWEQIWGGLKQEEVDIIGQVIKENKA